MATITETTTKNLSNNGHSVATVWTPLANGDAGRGVNDANHADRSIQVKGTFGTGGNVIIEGSNDDPVGAQTWATLHDMAGNALGTVTAAGIYMVQEVTRSIRPRVSAGDGTTALTVTMLARADF